jgi:hypothetical protein
LISLAFSWQLPPPFFLLYLLVCAHISGNLLIMAALWAEHRLLPMSHFLFTLSILKITSCMLADLLFTHHSTILWPVMNTGPCPSHWAKLTSAYSQSLAMMALWPSATCALQEALLTSYVHLSHVRWLILGYDATIPFHLIFCECKGSHHLSPVHFVKLVILATWWA